jgi:hypothetical protein
LVTGALHGAPVDYSQTQPYVDAVVEKGPEAWLDAEKNMEFLNKPIKAQGGMGYRYEFSKKRAPVLAELSKCYLHNQQVGMNDREAALNCAHVHPHDFKTKRAQKKRAYRLIPGMGRKGTALMREYLGDDNAVALDRQVYKYISEKHGFIPSVKPRLTNHGMSIPDKAQEEGEYLVKKLAAECDMTPADLQVAAWTWGACDSRTRTRRKHRGSSTVWLGPDFVLDCDDREKYYLAKGQSPP